MSCGHIVKGSQLSAALGKSLPAVLILRYNQLMSKVSAHARHAQLISMAVAWLRRHYKCGIVLSEQYCSTGEVPDVIAWRGVCKSVLVECKRLTVKPARVDLRSQVGMMKEMNLLLASLRRVEVRIEPQSITDFLKWKNRLAEYNGGALPEGITSVEGEVNPHLLV